MTIRFSCDCGKVLQAQDEHAGKRTKCPACGAQLTIPKQEAPPEPEPESPKKPAPSGAKEKLAQPRGREDYRDEGDREDDRDDEEEDRPRRRKPAASDTQSSGKALAALLLGIGSFCALALTGIPAIILGFLSIRDVNASGGKITGKGLAITGLILGALNTFICCPSYIGGWYWIYGRAKEAIEDAAGKSVSANNLRQLGLAMHNYNDSYKRLPPAASTGKDGRPLLSWRVALLPYLEQEQLYRQFRLDEPWDSPHNKTLISRMPRIFEIPGRSAPAGMTYYQVITAPPGSPMDPSKSPLFGGPQPPSIPMSFPDGTSNTILIVEAAEPVTWTKPDDVVWYGGPLPKFGDVSKPTFLVVLGDGSVRAIRRTINETTLRNAITPMDGNPLGLDW